MGKICLSHDTALEFWRRFRPHMGRDGVRLFGPGSLDRRSGYPDGLMFEVDLASILVSSRLLKTHDFTALDLESDPVDLLVGRAGKRRCTASVRAHSVGGELPAKSILGCAPFVCVVSPELCLVQMAKELDWVGLLLLMHEFCGYYTISDPRLRRMQQRLPLTSVERLAAYADEVGRIGRAHSLRTALSYAANDSASPRETAVFLLLTLPHVHGGYGLGRPALNAEVKLSHSAAKAFGSSSYCADLLWREDRIIVEYDGIDGHTGRERIARDASRRDALVAQGYSVFVITHEQLVDVAVFEQIALAIARRQGVRLRIRVKEFEARHQRLRRRLLG